MFERNAERKSAHKMRIYVVIRKVPRVLRAFNKYLGFEVESFASVKVVKSFNHKKDAIGYMENQRKRHKKDIFEVQSVELLSEDGIVKIN